jgi:DNA-binding SARP family transcriptional activator/tetratricopeptide (TPR) repeat protein
MEFLILGPLEARVGGRKLPLGGVKQRSLLAMLLLHAGEPVSSDRLIEALWPGARRRDSAKALTMAVARLRRVLEPAAAGDGYGVVVTRPPGYELRIGPDAFDLRRFERLLARARSARDPATAARTLREALALWRGRPLADLAYEPFCQSEIARLEELRLVAVEDRVDADLALGGGAELVAELEALVDEHPLRERLRGQLLVAFYRSGRQADALEAYQSARRVLVDELGIEPGPRLRGLHQAILEQDAALEPAAPAAAEESAPAGVFVGRARELAQLRAGVDDAVAGRGRVFLLSGEPGIGKSRLAEELARHARGRDATVLVGRCWEAGGAPAYWPWIHALRTYVRTCDTGTLAEQAGAGAADLAQVVPELAERLPGLPPPSTLEPDLVRFRLFDATAEFLRRVGESRPVVLVLDDLHAADEASLLLLRFLARQVGAARLLLVAAYRDVDPRPGRPLAEMLAEVTRESSCRRLELRGLGEPEVAEYLDRTAAELSSPRLAATLHERTEGNPLFVGELVRLLAIEGEQPHAVPPSVRDVIARRTTHLTAQGRELMVLASVLGREFRRDALAALAGRDGEHLLDGLDEAIASGLLSAVPGAADRLRFEHVLVRDTLYDGLSGARRMRLHQRAVEALEQLAGAPDAVRLAELAQHASAAGDHAKALRAACDAAGHALEAHAYEEAARLYGLALDALDRLRPAEALERLPLLLAAGDALASAGSTAASKDRFLAAAVVARSARRPTDIALAALAYGGRTVWQRAGDDHRLVPLLEEALAAIGDTDPVLRCRLLARLAGALRDQPSLEPRSSLSREAIGLARALGEPDLLADALVAHFLASWGPDVDRLVPLAREVGDLARRTGRPATVLDAITLDSVIAWLTFASTDAASLDDRYGALASDPADRWQAAMQDTVWALFRGEFARAERLAERARSSGEARRSDADCSYRLAMFLVRREQGRLAEIAGLMRDAVPAYPGYRSFRCFIPLLELELGRHAEARRAFEALASGAFGALPRDSEWLFCLCLLAEVAAGLGDRTAAEVLYGLLGPYARVNAMAAGEVSLGPVARFLGILAAATGRPDDAAGHFEDALAIDERMSARPWVAHTQEEYARVLGARDGPGDDARARDLLAACRATYRELGIVPSGG